MALKIYQASDYVTTILTNRIYSIYVEKKAVSL